MREERNGMSKHKNFWRDERHRQRLVWFEVRRPSLLDCFEVGFKESWIQEPLGGPQRSGFAD